MKFIFRYARLDILLMSVLILMMVLSCDQYDYGVKNNANAKVAVSLSSSSFDGESLSARSATPLLKGQVSDSLIQRKTIVLDDKLMIVAEFTPTFLSEHGETKSNVVMSELANGIKYRLLVYNVDAGGIYVTERDYVRGQESSASDLLLDGGTTYRFLVYSINSATANLPDVIPAVPSSRTLANTQVSVAGNLDFMYFSQTLTLNGGVVNNVDIVLKHRFSQITTIINSAQTGYNITAVNSSFQPHNTNSLIDMSTGTFVRNGTSDPSAVSFPTLNAQSITSTPTIINADVAATGVYTISSINIGSLQRTNLTPFSNLRITPGFRYTLTLNIVPQDEYVTYQGFPAARINGQIWALHNLGASPILNSPDQNPITALLHGNFFQFGRVAFVATGGDIVRNAAWNSSNTVSRSAWNSGTETSPVRALTDPCPIGYRVPTRTEYQNLVSSTTPSNRGNFTLSQTNYNSGKVLTSLRNANVYLVFPTQGIFNSSVISNPTVDNRGLVGTTWTSSASGNNVWRFSFTSTGVEISELTNSADFFVQARPIRCIGVL
ncbi:hypothetical protein [Sphingobacterium corticibacter]|uniref:Fibrobacter succinogenes major paralogous domain-containing protein n=1 Tax=Sphingobacterium corticibacter TaxID=2171749 RepID=A0A2T8HEY6_9SPHI|nr:hypothetical protein [Sphingobacterium corticibacter]PVH23922.1 hypothetical protein DC487_16980 [Sphingobacterium corticibacter]